MTSDTYTPAELARSAQVEAEHGRYIVALEHLNLTDRTTFGDTPPVVLASLALAPRDEHGEVIGEGW